jgi:uncharacterized protein
LADQPALTSLPVPTEDERTMAFLAHLLQVFTGFLAPLVIYCVKQNSRFVKYHALQSLVWQLCYMALFLVGIMIFFVAMFATVLQTASSAHGHAPPQPSPAVFLFLPLIWLLFIIGWVTNLVLGIMYGIKANRGEWAGYPIIGTWFLPKITPTNSPQSWRP